MANTLHPLYYNVANNDLSSLKARPAMTFYMAVSDIPYSTAA